MSRRKLDPTRIITVSIPISTVQSLDDYLVHNPGSRSAIINELLMKFLQEHHTSWDSDRSDEKALREAGLLPTDILVDEYVEEVEGYEEEEEDYEEEEL